jgi:hypothetical protein
MYAIFVETNDQKHAQIRVHLVDIDDHHSLFFLFVIFDEKKVLG